MHTLEQKPAPDSTLYRVRQFAERHAGEGWSTAAIRWLIFKSENNGLETAGAIVRVGRRVFVDEAKFYGWMRTQRKAE